MFPDNTVNHFSASLVNTIESFSEKNIAAFSWSIVFILVFYTVIERHTICSLIGPEGEQRPLLHVF